MAVIRGVPLQEGSMMRIHARTKHTYICAVDVVEWDVYPQYKQELEDVTTNFVSLLRNNPFINGVVHHNGIVHNSHYYPINPVLEQYTIHNGLNPTPVLLPNLILIFGIHTELCVIDHAESLSQQFPKSQILILSDLCKTKHGEKGDYFLFNYCMRSKNIDCVDSNYLMIINED